MADTLARETLVELARHNEWPSISIFIGTGPRSLDSGASSIRLKNLTRAAEKQLREQGLKATEIDGILRPATDLGAGRFFLERECLRWVGPASEPERDSSASLVDRANRHGDGQR